MQIHLEAADKHTIRSYSNLEIKINGILYHENFIVNKEEIITPWPLHSLKELSATDLDLILQLKPEIVIIGHQALTPPPFAVLAYLSQLKIGLECMSIGAACRTFNVLLSEDRAVVLGVIIPGAVPQVR